MDNTAARAATYEDMKSEVIALVLAEWDIHIISAHLKSKYYQINRKTVRNIIKEAGLDYMKKEIYNIPGPFIAR